MAITLALILFTEYIDTCYYLLKLSFMKKIFYRPFLKNENTKKKKSNDMLYSYILFDIYRSNKHGYLLYRSDNLFFERAEV